MDRFVEHCAKVKAGSAALVVRLVLVLLLGGLKVTPALAMQIADRPGLAIPPQHLSLFSRKCTL